MDGGANEVKRTCLALLGAANFILDKRDELVKSQR